MQVVHWRGEESLENIGHVVARVTSNDLQILQVCRSVSYKIIRVARATIGGSEPKKSAAVCGEVGQNGVSSWRRV